MFILLKRTIWISLGIFVIIIPFLGCDQAMTPTNKLLLPDISLDSRPIEVDFNVKTDLNQTSYVLPEQDKQRIMSLVEKIAPQEINTSNMDSYYSTYGFSVAGVPSSKILLTSPPENKTKYWRLYYQRGFIRVRTEIKNNSEKVKAKIFYNDKGAPVLVAKPFGKWYDCYFFEYDKAGYLKRLSRISFIRSLDSIAIYEVKQGYKNVVKYDFLLEDERFRLRERYLYSPEGSFSWSAKSGKEKRYSRNSFLDNLKIVEKYNLATILPIPE